MKNLGSEFVHIDHFTQEGASVDLYSYGNFLIRRTVTPPIILISASTSDDSIAVSCMQQEDLREDPVCQLNHTAFTLGPASELFLLNLQDACSLMELLKEGLLFDEAPL